MNPTPNPSVTPGYFQDQILGRYLHRETVQHKTIVTTQKAAASHINHPETEPSGASRIWLR